MTARHIQGNDSRLQFATVADMKVFPDGVLNLGDEVTTLEYSTGNGGGNRYEIVAAGTGTDDGGSFIDLSGIGFQAKGLWYNDGVGVKQFGAVGDGVTDDTLAIRAAIAYANSLRVSGNSGIWGVASAGSGVTIKINYGNGVYRVTDYLTSDATNDTWAYIQMVGDPAAIIADAGVTVFGGTGYQSSMKGLIIRGGECHVSVKTSNTDTVNISIVDCELQDATESLIRSDTNSNSTILTIDRCKLMQKVARGEIINIPTLDYCNINNSWIHAFGVKAGTVGYDTTPTNWLTSTAYVVGDYVEESSTNYYCLEDHTSGTFATDLAADKWVAREPASSPTKLMINNCLGVPGGDLVSVGSRWFDVYGEFHCDRFRFGGENAGNSMFRFYGGAVSGGGINIQNTSAFSGLYNMEFYGLPEFLYLENCNGFENSDGMYFDSAITSEQFRVWQEDGLVDFKNLTPDALGGLPFLVSPNYDTNTTRGILIILAKLHQKNQTQRSGATKRLKGTQVLASFEQQSGWTSSVANGFSAGNSDVYDVQNRVFTAKADDANFTYNMDTLLTPAADVTAVASTELEPNKAYTFITVLDSVPNPWLTATAYVVGNYVSEDSTGVVLNYECLEDHTSGTFATDLAANKWVVRKTAPYPTQVKITIGGMERFVSMTGGRQVISIPFVYLNDTETPNVNMDRIAYSAREIRNGAAFNYARQMLVEGFVNYDEEVCILTGTATPAAFAGVTSQTDKYFRGDMSYATNVASAGHIGRVCTVEGDPGTWNTFGVVS